jgi:hypothetical protein
MPGVRVLADLATAGRDAARFPDPGAVRLDRPDADYAVFVTPGPHQNDDGNGRGGGGASQSIVTTGIAAMLGVLARACPGVRSTPGVVGEMQKKEVDGGVFTVYLSDDGGRWESLPVCKSFASFLCPSQSVSIRPGVILSV